MAKNAAIVLFRQKMHAVFMHFAVEMSRFANKRSLFAIDNGEIVVYNYNAARISGFTMCMFYFYKLN